MRFLTLSALLAAIPGLYAPPLEATQILISYNDASLVCSGSVLDPSFTGAAPVAYSNSCVPTAGATIGVNGEASLSTIKLGLNTAGPSQNTQANVLVVDSVIAAGAAANGTLVFSWDIDGSLAPDDTFLAELVVSGLGLFGDYRACGPNAFALPCTSRTGTVTVHDTLTVSVPITFGSPTALQWSFNALIACPSPIEGGACYPFANTGINSVNFFNTAQLRPIVVLDSNGNQVLGASVLSESGFSYAIADAVSEPASIVLLGTGLAAMFLDWRRKRA